MTKSYIIGLKKCFLDQVFLGQLWMQSLKFSLNLASVLPLVRVYCFAACGKHGVPTYARVGGSSSPALRFLVVRV